MVFPKLNNAWRSAVIPVQILSFVEQLKLCYSVFLVPPKSWRFPAKADLLIYDRVGSEVLAALLDREFTISVLDVRGESLNLPCFIKALFMLSFWQMRPLSAYATAFARSVNPRLIITFIDNNPAFYSLSHVSGIPTAFVQNGLRTDVGDVFGNPKAFRDPGRRVDHMFVFGPEIGKKYQSRLPGEISVIGSLKNNMVVKRPFSKSGKILFVSQYRPKPTGCNFFISDDASSMQISHDAFYSAEAIVIPFLDRWCHVNGKELLIAGACSRDADCQEEKEFFESLVSHGHCRFARRLTNSSYELLDHSEIVVSIDSTLGYEALARGIKTAFFSLRSEILGLASFSFGWPLQLGGNGPFWTNEPDEKQLLRVMMFLLGVSCQDWLHSSAQHAKRLMLYDESNSIFVNKMRSIVGKA